MDGKRTSSGVHALSLEGRNRLMITEVLDVGSFNEQEILVNLSFGGLSVKGQNLHIQKLDPDSASIVITGQVQTLAYSEKKESSGDGFLKKLFK